MISRHTLLQSWRKGLVENQVLAADGSSHFRWLHVMQARVYRYLLARYGGGDWRPELSAREPKPHALAAAKTVEFGAGTPPKTAGRIQATLKALHAAGPERKPGTTRAMKPNGEYWYPIGSLRNENHELVAAFRDEMDEQGIPYEIEHSGSGCVFRTEARDRQWAARVLGELKIRYPQQRLAFNSSRKVPLKSRRTTWYFLLLSFVSVWFFGTTVALAAAGPRLDVVMAAIVILAALALGIFLAGRNLNVS